MFDLSAAKKEELIDKIAKKVVDLRLSPVAIVMLESAKPVSFLGNQTLIFFQPFYYAFFSSPLYDEFTALIEERDNIELLIQRIEHFEEEYNNGQKRSQDNPRH